MPSTRPVSFTVEFDDFGEVIDVKRADGGPVTREAASNMAQRLANVTVRNSTITEVLICNSSSGEADPCVKHGGDIFCW
jgi:hypothetical protein